MGPGKTQALDQERELVNRAMKAASRYAAARMMWPRNQTNQPPFIGEAELFNLAHHLAANFLTNISNKNKTKKIK